MDWTAIATLILAFFTFALAVATVFGEWLQGLVFYPVLHIDISNSARYIWSSRGWSEEPVQEVWHSPSPPPSPLPSSSPRAVTPAKAGQHDFYWIRFGISNWFRWCSVPARDIEVFISAITKEGAAEELDFVGFNLKWAFESDITKTDLLPGVTKYCDLGRLWHQSGRVRFDPQYSYSGPRDRNLLELASAPQPRNFSFLREPGRYRLTLLVGGKNVKVAHYTLTLEFPADWYNKDDDMRRAIVLKVTRGA